MSILEERGSINDLFVTYCFMVSELYMVCLMMCSQVVNAAGERAAKPKFCGEVLAMSAVTPR